MVLSSVFIQLHCINIYNTSSRFYGWLLKHVIMETENNMVELLKDIKGLLSQQKKVMNIDDLVAYTGLSKSKIYKLTQLKLIPMGGNKHIRQKFFNKDIIDAWLLGEPNLSDEHLEREFNKQLSRNKR